jgi:hypothetical protein
LAGHRLRALDGDARRSALEALEEQAGQIVGVNPCEFIVTNDRQVGAQDELRVVVDGGDRAGEAWIYGNVDHANTDAAIPASGIA